MTFTWQNGRQLQSAAAGGKSLSFAYNADGIRTKKTVDGVTTRYTLNGTQVLAQQTGTDAPLYFTYDASGRPYSMTCGGTTVYYLCNLSGDVFALLDADGNRIVEYTYGPFGQLLEVYGTAAATFGAINPLRYRGYYYDTETGLYYLNSRYYDPEVGRFINADGVIDPGNNGSVLDYNYFIYSRNNPVNCPTAGSPAMKSATSVCQLTKQVFLISKDDNQVAGLSKSIRYNVPLYNQSWYSLCWAFCQVMVEDYKAGIIRDNFQATCAAISIAKSVYRDDWNQGGWPTNSYNLFGETGINSLDSLYNALLTRGPLYAYYGNETSAHLVVVTGVDMNRGIVYTNNPWGISGEQTYSQFLNGFAGMPEDWHMPFGFYILVK